MVHKFEVFRFISFVKLDHDSLLLFNAKEFCFPHNILVHEESNVMLLPIHKLFVKEDNYVRQYYECLTHLLNFMETYDIPLIFFSCSNKGKLLLHVGHNNVCCQDQISKVA